MLSWWRVEKQARTFLHFTIASDISPAHFKRKLMRFCIGGDLSGASQPHKHMQFLEIENEGPPVEILAQSVNLESPGWFTLRWKDLLLKYHLQVNHSRSIGYPTPTTSSASPQTFPPLIWKSGKPSLLVLFYLWLIWWYRQFATTKATLLVSLHIMLSSPLSTCILFLGGWRTTF